jgi:glycosyltransferase involved in cell wall biosynthesis
VCQTYGLGGHEWKVQVNRASHSIDPLLIWPYDGLTKDLARKIDLLSGELTAVYPARLDRGKQPEKIIRLMAGIAKVGYEPRLLIIDWQSTGERFQKYIDELQSLSIRLGLSGKVGFTSRMDDRCSQGVPRHVVLELMDLCNLYIHPSRIETYSLVIGEAMGRGCLCILNHDLPVMRELWGDSAIYADFGSDRVNRDYPQGEQTFWNDEALRLLAEFKQNRAQVGKTRARMRWTPQKMWKEFEPLLYLTPVGE